MESEVEPIPAGADVSVTGLGSLLVVFTNPGGMNTESVTATLDRLGVLPPA